MKLWACVVCYGTSVERLRPLVRAIEPHVDELLLMDNAADRSLRTLAGGRTRYIPMPGNLGTGGAMNAAWRLALDAGCEALIAFDQDSLPQPDMIPRLATTLGEMSDRGERVGAIGPAKVDPRTGRRGRLLLPVRFRRRFADASLAAPVALDHLITSGCLIPSAVFRDVGDYNEALFLDYVDMEWCQRARAKGYMLVCEPRAVLQHTIGDRVFTAGGRMMALHQPLRNYLLLRNHLLMWRVRAIPRLWLASDALQVLKKLAASLVLGGARLERLRWLWRAAGDGARGHGGPPTKRLPPA